MDNSAVAIGNPAAAEWVPVASLTPWAQNPKPHDAANLKEIARSIRRFDFGAPIVAWKSQQRVVAGHGRLEAARLLLAEDPGRLLATDAPGPGLVPVRWVEFASEQEAAAYALADNRLTEANPMDEGQVAAILASFDGPVEIPGYDEEALSALLAMNEPEAPDEPEGDLTPPDEPQSRVGEVYELGPHRLVCGDCRDAGMWDLLLGEDLADLVFTDPPYGVAYEGGHNEEKRDIIIGDKLIGDDLTGLFYDSLSLTISYTYPHSAFYIWFASGKSVEVFKAFSMTTLKLRAVIQWYKIQSGLGAFMAQYIPNCEPCLYAHKNGCAPQWFGPSNEKTVWELPRESVNEYHPTQKPVPLAVRAIQNSSRPQDIVADPFGGSGTTLIACAQTGRRCRMIEIDPRYCDVIRRRYTRYAQEAGLDPGPGALP